jgi:hypothetical protein
MRMSSIARGLMVFVLACVSAGVAAQTPTPAKPDFSGRWTLDTTPAPGAPGGGRGGGRGDMGSGWGSPITITQDASRLMVEYVFFAPGDLQPPLKFVYALDGSETKNSVMMGRGIQTQVSRTRWDGDKLIITTRHAFVDPGSGKTMTMDVTQTLSLESPAVLLVEATRAGVLGGEPTSTKARYKKS